MKLEYLKDDERCGHPVGGHWPGPCWRGKLHSGAHYSEAGYKRSQEQARESIRKQRANWTPGPCGVCKVNPRRKGNFDCLDCARKANRAIRSRETVCANAGCTATAPVGNSLCLQHSREASVAHSIKTGYTKGRRRREREHNAEGRYVDNTHIDRANGCCYLCEVEFACGVEVHVEHVYPVSKIADMPDDFKSELRLACGPCNLKKGDRLDFDPFAEIPADLYDEELKEAA